jgi:hypothetical protein
MFRSQTMRSKALGCRCGLRAAGGGGLRVAHVPKHPCLDAEQEGIVVHQQDARLARCSAGRSRFRDSGRAGAGENGAGFAG